MGYLITLGVSALVSGCVAGAVSAALKGRVPALERTNFHGVTVSLRGGLGVGAGSIAAAGALVGAGSLTGAGALDGVGACTGAATLAAGISTTAAAGAGLADDLDAGAHDGDRVAKGLKGHLGALARGQVTTGVFKIAVIGGAAVASGALLAASRASNPRTASSLPSPGQIIDAAGSAVVVASWANVMNLLDLRPGRALKVVGLGATVLLAGAGKQAPATRTLAAGTLGVVAASLGEDLAERTMLGDTGANAIGALLGTAIAAHPSPALRSAAGLTGVGLILASECVSFSRVIERTPGLKHLDALGRHP